MPRGSAIFVSAIALAGLGLHAGSYLPFLSDDALISLRYAQRLLEGRGLTWTDGPAVEGYSNLLWVLGCAALGGLGLDLIDAARVLGAVGSSAAVLALVAAQPPRAPGLPLPALASVLALALSGSVAAWTVGGLEQPLLAGLLAWACVWLLPLLEPAVAPARVWKPGVALALLCWTRPDGPLFALGAGLGLALARGADRATLRLALRLALLPALAVAGQLAFRLARYGEWLPNSAFVKLAFGEARLWQGLVYLDSALRSHLPLVLAAAALSVVLARDERGVQRLRLWLPMLVLWCAYVVAVGGDLFPAHRHFVPAVVLLALLLGEGLRALLDRTPRWRRLAWPCAALVLAGLGLLQARDPQNLRARSERWEWDGQVVGRLLHRAFGDRRPLLAVDPAGTLPYFSGLPSLDMLGLNDHTLARLRPPDFGRAWVGHELGSGDYVLSREPDLVLFCSPEGGAHPCFRSGRELVRDPRFREAYRLVHLEGREPYPVRTSIWLRTEGGRLGVERSAGRVSVPAYLLTSDETPPARLTASGRLAVSAGEGVPLVLRGLGLEPGLWTARARASGATRLAVATAGRGDWREAAGDALRFSVARPDERVDLRVRAAGPGAPVLMEALEIEAAAAP